MVEKSISQNTKSHSAKAKLLGKVSSKAQSAMEYLMTYGWAILIIAIVLAALFQLGVFNSTNFAPKAQPGSCQVFRPNGPGTTSFINTEGVCSGELPQYVVSFSGSSTQQILASSTPVLSNLQNGATWTVWFSVSPDASGTMAIANQVGGSPATWIDYYFPEPAQLRYEAGTLPCSIITSTSAIASGTWYFAALVYSPSSNTVTGYLDNNLEGSCSNAGVSTSDPGSLQIGYYINNYFNGQVANFQIYNTSLSGPEVNALYLEGIGGAPFELQNLVGWWPLNGNANDYSGNGNNGVPTNVIFTSSWESGYTPP